MKSAKSVGLVLASWFAAALAISISGVLATAKPPAPQVLIFTLTVCAMAAALGVPRLREWCDQASPRGLVSVHLSRFVGIYFLVLANRGELPRAFATPAGWGDIAVAIGAACLLFLKNGDSPANRRAFDIWNVLGLIDIVFVVASAARFGLADPASMKALLRLPLSLLPTFLVPLIITSHLLLFRRLARMRRAA